MTKNNEAMNPDEVLPPEAKDAVATRSAGNVAPVQTVMEQAAVAELKIAAQMAKMYPRDMVAVRDELLESCKRPRFAETARYSKPIGNSAVKGLSIRFAEEAMRTMGNIRVTELPIFDSDDERVTSVTAWDCQTMAHAQKAVVTKKVIERKSAHGRTVVGPPEGRLNSYGDKIFLVRATEDEVLVKESANCSKVRRNLILAIIPSDLREDAEERILRTLGDRDAKDPKGEMKKLMDAFSALRVKPAGLSRWLGHPVDEASPAEIAELREVYTSVRDGEASFAQHLEQRDEARAIAASRKETGTGDASDMQSNARQRGATAGAEQKQKPVAQPEPKEEPQADEKPAATRRKGAAPKAEAKPEPEPEPEAESEAEDEAPVMPTAKEVAAFVAYVTKSTGGLAGDIVGWALSEVFDGATDVADIPMETLKERKSDMVECVRRLASPMGGEMSDKVFDAIVARHPNSTDDNDEVQVVVDALCTKFEVSAMDDLPQWAAMVWPTLGVTPATTHEQ